MALTDLASWTCPAESHLSEMLPDVLGLKTPDRSTQDGVKLKRSVCLSGACVRARVYISVSLWCAITCVCLLCLCVCTDMSNAVY